MILDRLLVRHKLNLLVAVPLVMVAVLMVTLLAGQVGRARLARSTAQTADTARQVSVLVEEIQLARLLTVAYLDAELASASSVDLQFAAVADAQAQLLRALGPDAHPELLDAVRSAGAAARFGPLVIGRAIGDQGVVGALNSVVGQLIGALHLDRQDAASARETWTLAGLDALLRADEAASQSGALLLMAASNPAVRAQAASDAAVAQGTEQEESAAFGQLATPSQVALFRQTTQGQGAQRLADATAEVGLAGATTAQSDVARHVFAAVQSQTTLRQLVESSIAQDISLSAGRSSSSVLTGAALLSGLGVLVLIGVVLLSWIVGRSVSIPLRRLTSAAGSVADVADEELANVADDDAGPAAVRRLAALPVGPRDELGELAVAFNRVQATTAQLLERQVAGRRNVAAMFAGIGRRTSNLVGRQLALIDALESAEEDSRTLGTLYRLDHLSTRLRRNASSLVVLSGSREVADEVAAVSLPDAVRAALGSIEEFQRVALTALPDVHLSPGVVADVVLILSELIENGVLFSPPHTSVEVGAWVTDDARYALTVVDHGIGMPAQRLAEENVRLRQRERLDLAPTDVLGLFVVGRVSRRHGIEVTLIPTPGGGVTARVGLPATLFVDNPWSGADAGFPRASRRTLTAADAEPAWDRPEPVGAAARAADAGFDAGFDARFVAGFDARSDAGADAGSDARAVAGPPVAAGREPAADPEDAGIPRPAPAAAEAPATDLLRRRVPGTHWGGSPPIPASDPPASDPAAPGGLEVSGLPAAHKPVPDRIPASRVAAFLDGVPPGFGSGDLPGPPDPEATRRQVQDLESALAGLDPAPVPPVAPTGPVDARLVRRVPGATLAALGAVLPEAPAPRASAPDPVQIDADEMLRVILDVDEAVRRAGAHSRADDGSWATGDAVSRWGGREDGGGR